VFRRALAVCRYHGSAAEVVKALKFGRDLRALEVMGPMLAERVAQADFAKDIEVVVPVPLHWARRSARRFNQAALLAERVNERLRVDLAPKAMKRVRYTTPQSLLPGREREAALKGAFAVRDRAAVDGARVLLVDDVMTTCATARECAVTLRDAGARSVDVAVFAR
jgi:ComF family protein